MNCVSLLGTFYVRYETKEVARSRVNFPPLFFLIIFCTLYIIYFYLLLSTSYVCEYQNMQLNVILKGQGSKFCIVNHFYFPYFIVLVEVELFSLFCSSYVLLYILFMILYVKCIIASLVSKENFGLYTLRSRVQITYQIVFLFCTWSVGTDTYDQYQIASLVSECTFQ